MYLFVLSAVVLEFLLSSEVRERLLGRKEELPLKSGRPHINLPLRFHTHLMLLRQSLHTLFHPRHHPSHCVSQHDCTYSI